MGHVPPIYYGLWQRTLYAEPADGEPTFEDRDTRVLWLQAGDWHADLRVSTVRPDFTGVSSLADCGRNQLIWLARQTAFAGITRVEGRFCTWHRLVDLSPGLEKDIGEMRFIDYDTLEECHPRRRYREVWRRVSPRIDTQPVVRLDDTGLPVRLVFGDHAMFITPRDGLVKDHDLLTMPTALTSEQLTQRAALTLSYAERRGEQWLIRLSTWPWMEDRLVPDADS
ncbi:hypothetical protein [Salinisphaera aquimarina]|uniref:Uncharacterized protein n=1 Tax=Salinisphaera aquimarina TaxID=2094031 RepID=A0ABV7EK50_9GAMM